MLNPVSTYRIQFHKEFTFKDFNQIIPYLKDLGIRTIYASPILEAVPGSTHGYDTINPHRINPEIGTLGELRAIAEKLKGLGIAWIQDIVPNHMAFDPGNAWLMDVLEKGQESEYAAFFDINWVGDKQEPVMVPFLGTSVEEAISSQQLTLVDTEKGIKLRYADTDWPVNAAVTSSNMPVLEAVDAQYYRLCSWKETNSKINYRRFFTVNSLICLNMQDEHVFKVYHEFIDELLKEDVFQGLRVDHIDGLYDPETYFARLREMAGEDIYIVVEKILEEGETVPYEWPVEGTTGYDFLAQVNNLFTNKKAKKEFTKFYESITGDDKTIERQIRQKKAGILSESMAGELENLYTFFLELELATEEELDRLKPGALKDAIGQLLICCPVYRFYGSRLPLDHSYAWEMKEVFKEINVVKTLKDAVKLLKEVLLNKPKDGEEDYINRATQFYLRCMQLSGPLMAKGVEDTLMYTYNRFIGHNEVGDAPSAFGIGKKDFHQLMRQRSYSLPVSMNGTSTHDTKRGEDVRARLNVLTDLPEEWLAKVKEWIKLNTDLTGGLDPNDEYFIYQTITGSYPMPGMPNDNYSGRLQAYLEKSLREGKVNSNWSDPDMDYEQLVKDFIIAILDEQSEFWKSFSAFYVKVADFGILNSLSQLMLKFSLPGMPDTHQGTELWDLSLVDPDNRRPVDYLLRDSMLKEIEGLAIKDLWAERDNGKIKLSVLHTLLKEVAQSQNLFVEAEYIQLKVKGKYAGNLFAFARREGMDWWITIVPLHLAHLCAKEGVELQDIDWQDTVVELPERASFEWKSLLTGKKSSIYEPELPVNDIFDELPMGIVRLKQLDNKRGAGILLSVSSLPSPYGIGDMGNEAMAFLEFLQNAEQKYWQLLPLNPVSTEQAYSPYSSVSAMAGNPALISLDLLATVRDVDAHELNKLKLKVKDEVDYEKVIAAKTKLLRKVCDSDFENHVEEMDLYKEFCEREKDWLDDFALFTVLKEQQNGLPWFEWEPAYRDREPEVLKQFAAVYEEELRFVKWQQERFFNQWEQLRRYAVYYGITLYGDLPFYVSHDSADVWSHRELFSLDKDGKMIGVAGVPPDYFNADGQLWGMPVYNWDKMKVDGYSWWMKRIRKNMELYDLLRLDHFRAFADYWEVPAGETTAVNGTWKLGPGADFFTVLEEEFPEMPFIAEDLGEISDEVYELRDKFKLPGMKVLQFAFGNDISKSGHIPHNFESDNFVVYSGTHDNDTTKGWYMKEADKAIRSHLNEYTGIKVTEKNVHDVLARLAYGTVAKIAILPMQDILGLDGRSRMNKPASVEGNWKWRMRGLPGKAVEKSLRDMVRLFGRG